MTTYWGGWSDSPEAQRVFGDAGPWIQHLPLAWQAAAAPRLHFAVPPDPTADFVRSAGTEQWEERHGELIAYWGPLLHLLHFGLGWSRVDRGLAAWMELGCPTEDPILSVVARWWSRERLEDFLAFSARSSALIGLGEQIASNGGYRNFDTRPSPDRYAQRREGPQWQAVWGGGGDPLHLTGHTLAPLESPEGGLEPTVHWPVSIDSADRTAIPRMALLTDRYAGWHAMLWHHRPTQAANGRSIRTDVVCTPLGSMGEYRYSTQTRAWFRGRHQWHALGH